MIAAARAAPFHWLRLRATCHATEDEARVQEAVRFLSGLDPERFAAQTRLTRLESHYGGAVTLVETTLERSREIRAALAPVLEAHRDLLAGELAERLDDETFYVRFDKQAACGGKRVLTRGDDAVQVRAKVVCHPANRENAMAALKAYLINGY